eukprot:TRINITY_DN3567_c0_g1_i1.p1 TRINITY_DN3567_c0_g1~~TRINITY_DN3567_c0_g1_i1.p1  ORF type:complete len:436 (+),score=56.92 TRINITY_DN3567_c0_g1_i1:142-1308(+)
MSLREIKERCKPKRPFLIDGTMKELLQWMMFVNTDQDTLHCFLLCFRCFDATPVQFLHWISSFYNDPSMQITKKDKVIRFLVNWIIICRTSDFNEETEDGRNALRLINEFLSKLETSGNATQSDVVKQALIQSLEYNSDEKRTRRKSKTEYSSQSNVGLYQHLLDVPCALLSEQLCLREFQLLKAIKMEEFYHQVWSKEKKTLLAPNICKLIDHFNNITSWISVELLNAHYPKLQKKKIKFLIDLADILYRSNNFNGVMEIVASLNTIDVLKLTDAWKLVSSKCRSRLRDLEDVMSYKNNFRTYRSRLVNPLGNGPVIPWIGLYLHDLTTIDEGQDNFISNGQINLDKLENLGSLFFQFYQFQDGGSLMQFSINDAVQQFFDKKPNST